MDKLPSRRILEKALRDVGLSCRQAKKLLSGGLKQIASEEELTNEGIEERLDKLTKEIEALKQIS